MNKCIFYLKENNGVVLVMPAPECPLTIEQIAQKDVPKNVPYLILDVSQIPTDFTFYDAWEADFSNPDGYGIGAEDWFAQQSNKGPEV